MKARHFIVVAAAVATLAGCGSPTAAPSPAPAATAEATAGGPAVADDSAGYVETLRTIDPTLVGDPDKAIATGRSICQDVEAGKPVAEIQKNAAARLGVEPDIATVVIGVARNKLCAG